MYNSGERRKTLGMQICCVCKKKKPVHEFYKDKSKVLGYSSTCKNCSHARRLRQNPEDARRTNLLYYFKLTVEDYDRMLAQQDGMCAICNRPEISLSNRGDGIKRLAIDHDHKTNKIRGLLCTRCNTALGCLREDETIVTNLLSYIRERR